jgi:hypothetical protein
MRFFLVQEITGWYIGDYGVFFVGLRMAFRKKLSRAKAVNTQFYLQFLLFFQIIIIKNFTGVKLTNPEFSFSYLSL